MATRKQIAAARKNIKKAHAANRKTHGRKSGRKTGRRSACTSERWSGPCRAAKSGKFRSC